MYYLRHPSLSNSILILGQLTPFIPIPCSTTCATGRSCSTFSATSLNSSDLADASAAIVRSDATTPRPCWTCWRPFGRGPASLSCRLQARRCPRQGDPATDDVAGGVRRHVRLRRRIVERGTFDAVPSISRYEYDQCSQRQGRSMSTWTWAQPMRTWPLWLSSTATCTSCWPIQLRACGPRQAPPPPLLSPLL